MTDLPSQQEMSPEQKAIRKIELQQLNDLADKATGRVIPIGQPWHTERNLSKETKAALDSLEPKQPQKPESPLYKLPEGMDQKLKNFDEVIKNRPSSKAIHGAYLSRRSSHCMAQKFRKSRSCTPGRTEAAQGSADGRSIKARMHCGRGPSKRKEGSGIDIHAMRKRFSDFYSKTEEVVFDDREF